MVSVMICFWLYKLLLFYPLFKNELLDIYLLRCPYACPPAFEFPAAVYPKLWNLFVLTCLMLMSDSTTLKSHD